MLEVQFEDPVSQTCWAVQLWVHSSLCCCYSPILLSFPEKPYVFFLPPQILVFISTLPPVNLPRKLPVRLHWCFRSRLCPGAHWALQISEAQIYSGSPAVCITSISIYSSLQCSFSKELLICSENNCCCLALGEGVSRLTCVKEQTYICQGGSMSCGKQLPRPFWLELPDGRFAAPGAAAQLRLAGWGCAGPEGTLRRPCVTTACDLGSSSSRGPKPPCAWQCLNVKDDHCCRALTVSVENLEPWMVLTSSLWQNSCWSNFAFVGNLEMLKESPLRIFAAGAVNTRELSTSFNFQMY